MNLYHFHEGGMQRLDWPGNGQLQRVPRGFFWLVMTRQSLPESLPEMQRVAQSLGGGMVLDLHCRDLMSEQHPSHYEDTSVYDRIIFRRLMRHAGLSHTPPTGGAFTGASPEVLHGIDTEAVSFILFDTLLISVHPEGCDSAHRMVERYQMPEPGGTRPRAPAGAVDLMLRMIDLIVDDYLALRKDLSVGLETWLSELLKANPKVKDWTGFMGTRNALHNLEDVCNEQQEALQEWLSVYEQGNARNLQQAERDGMVARARDLIEHLQRVSQHVRRLESSAETGVQIYFGAQSHRTNNIMRTLTALTAVFLPLNLITGFFGMNFEFLPLIHQPEGLWWAVAAMVIVAVILVLVFWRKRYLARSTRESI
jgi:Mg2+ and Co2+ transporter CorA